MEIHQDFLGYTSLLFLNFAMIYIIAKIYLKPFSF